jgi:hypothetical protein
MEIVMKPRHLPSGPPAGNRLRNRVGRRLKYLHPDSRGHSANIAKKRRRGRGTSMSQSDFNEEIYENHIDGSNGRIKQIQPLPKNDGSNINFDQVYDITAFRVIEW